jgi:hypothetical protein
VCGQLWCCGDDSKGMAIGDKRQKGKQGPGSASVSERPRKSINERLFVYSCEYDPSVLENLRERERRRRQLRQKCHRVDCGRCSKSPANWRLR